MTVRSIVVVTSWWSNCLALVCLHRLRSFAPRREIWVMQAGKLETQMERFREFLPPGVEEIPYPSHIGPDDSAMREYLAKDTLAQREGVWFFDHDAFLLDVAEPFFETADVLFNNSRVCLCTRSPLLHAGVTQPAYWLSPARWPRGISSFAPVPFQPRPYTQWPDLHRHAEELTMPGKDTLVQAQEELDAMGMAGTFPTEGDDGTGHFLPSFPEHIHIGGLHLYTGPALQPAGAPRQFVEWRRHTLLSFDAFFQHCPSEWVAIEDGELMARHKEMMETLHEAKRDGDGG